MRKAIRRAAWAAALGVGLAAGAPLLGQTPPLPRTKFAAPRNAPIKTIAASNKLADAHDGEPGERKTEVAVELAWLGDPEVYACNLGVRVEAGQLKIWGYVPAAGVKQTAVRLAQQFSGGLTVVDSVRVQYNMADRSIGTLPPEQMQQTAQSLLQVACPERADNLEVKCRSDGRVILTGVVSTLEEKLACSRHLRGLPGCTAVSNNLQVARTLGVEQAFAPTRASTAAALNGPSTKKFEPIRTPAASPEIRTTGSWEGKPSDKVTPSIPAPPLLPVAPPKLTPPPVPVAPPAVVAGPALPPAPIALPGPALQPEPTPVAPKVETKTPAITQAKVPEAGVSNKTPETMVRPVPSTLAGLKFQELKPNPAPGSPTAPASKQPFESTGIVDLSDPEPTPTPSAPPVARPVAPSANLKPAAPAVDPQLRNRLKQQIERVCGGAARNIEVIIVNPRAIRIVITVTSDAVGAQCAERIMSDIPELFAYAVDVDPIVGR